MKAAIELVKQEHESSSTRTKQYLATRRKFLNEFKKFLARFNLNEFVPSKPNHFDIDGFFRVDDQWFYFSVSDLRWNKDKMLIRKAKSTKDFRGEGNSYIRLKSEQEFIEDFSEFMSSGYVFNL